MTSKQTQTEKDVNNGKEEIWTKSLLDLHIQQQFTIIKKKNFFFTLSTVRFLWESDIAKPHVIPKANSPTIPNHKFNKSKRKTLLMREAQKKSILILFWILLVNLVTSILFHFLE